ncbi:hypothetical protein HK100_009201 [Physocladia obscura]|uniref:Glycosyltransferase n=1 Tax=Physocladia obscura TaxID=109957 RepID=A0AAD5T3J1_9FUNG|nr:hypothetical protein HK100_009201 [Physocladia obscura]
MQKLLLQQLQQKKHHEQQKKEQEKQKEQKHQNKEAEKPVTCTSSHLQLLWDPTKPVNFSTSTNITSVLYYNTHSGTNANFAAVAKSLSFKLHSFDPRAIVPYGMSETAANRIIASGHVGYLCTAFDVIVIADTLPHARHFIQSIVDGNPCRAQIIVEMTNRFNWEVKDTELYHETIRVAVERRLVQFVANNRAEHAFLEDAIGLKFEPDVRQVIVRPLGISVDAYWPRQYGVQNINTFVARENFCGDAYKTLKNKYHLPIAIVPAATHYGGPKNLAKFKAFIDFPYQYSVMKFYENIAYGVPQYLPTPRFWEEVLDNKLHCAWWASPNVLKNLVKQRDKNRVSNPNNLQIIKNFPDWSAYMDLYDPLFEPYVYYFDSIDELLALVNQTPDQVDWKNVRTNGPLFYEKYREMILKEWEKLIFEG